MPTALITGIAGFTGRYMAARLLGLGYDVHGLVRSDHPYELQDDIAFHSCDIVDEDRVAAIIAAVRPEFVIHLAAIAFVAHGDMGEMYRSNILGVRSLLQACTRADTPPTLLLASSANVYGNAAEGILNEDTPMMPANDYGITKVAGEYVARMMANRLPVIVARPFNYTGFGQSPSYLIPKIVDHVRRRAARIELGNLDVARDFSDVRAVVDIYARMLKEPSVVGGTFNVCSGRALTLKDILDMCAGISGHSMDIVVNPAFVRSNEVRLLCGTAAKLESFIGPLDIPPLEQTLRWMIEQECV